MHFPTVHISLLFVYSTSCTITIKIVEFVHTSVATGLDDPGYRGEMGHSLSGLLEYLDIIKINSSSGLIKLNGSNNLV